MFLTQKIRRGPKSKKTPLSALDRRTPPTAFLSLFPCALSQNAFPINCRVSELAFLFFLPPRRREKPRGENPPRTKHSERVGSALVFAQHQPNLTLHCLVLFAGSPALLTGSLPAARCRCEEPSAPGGKGPHRPLGPSSLPVGPRQGAAYPR